MAHQRGSQSLRRIAYAGSILAAVIWTLLSANAIAPGTPPDGSIRHSSAPLSLPAAALLPLYPVTRVIDGDTIKVAAGSTTRTIRMIGIDTPETVDPEKPIECYGAEASAEAKALLAGREVRIVQDPSQDVVDAYGRTLAYVYRDDGLFYNEYMVANGFAREYTFRTAYAFQAQFREDEAHARSLGIGLWSPATCAGDTGVGSHPLGAAPS